MSLRERVLHSLKWLAAARLGGQMIAWLITLVVIRILDPSDYGLMAIAALFIGFADLFREMGLYSAMVQSRDLTDKQIEQAFGLLIVINAAIYMTLLLLAPGIARFFQDPRLTDIIRVLGLQFPLASVGVVQNAMLSRAMAFKRTSAVNFIAMLTNSLTTLLCAFGGLGVWALVWGSLLGQVARSGAFLLAARHRCVPRFSRDGMGSMAQFGGFITVTRLLWYSYQRADILIIGRVLSTQTLGHYQVAMQLASMPLQKFSSMMNDVGLAAYSTVQTDPAAISYYYLKALRTVAFLAFPVFWGISSVAPELVNVVLGAKWQPAIVPLAVLSVIMPLRMISSSSGAAYEAVGKPHINTGSVLIAFLVMIPAFLVGVQWGLIGISLAWLLVYPIQFFIRQWRVLPAIGVTAGQYTKSLAGPVAGAGLMYVVVLVLRITVADPYLHPIAGLALLIISGSFCYALYMWFAQNDDCLEIMHLFNKGKTAG